VTPVALKEVLPLTGYVRGGVTALAAKQDSPVVLDRSAEQWPEISVSAEMRGMQILLAPSDDARATRARAPEIARRSEG
jgi:Cys-tRNA(Pro)/Cys-tRNA(Cys) deacylase